MEIDVNAGTKSCRPRAGARALEAAATVVLSVLLHACGGGAGQASANPQPSPGPGPDPGGTPIVAWGDSWTSGVGAIDGMSFPDQLRMGGNNFFEPEGVKSDMAKAVGFLFTGKFIVLGLLNAGSEPRGSASHAQITRLNTDLARAYPDNFLDIRAILVASYDPSSRQDIADHANDVPPASLRNDDQHPNEAGYAIVAQQVAGIIRAKGW